jgi:hypothetical protein
MLHTSRDVLRVVVRPLSGQKEEMHYESLVPHRSTDCHRGKPGGPRVGRGGRGPVSAKPCGARPRGPCRRGAQNRLGRHGLRPGGRGPGALDDAGPGVLLRRYGPPQEHPGNPHAVHDYHLPDRRAVGRVRLQPGVRAGQLFRGRPRVAGPGGRRRGAVQGLRRNDPPRRVHDLPGDVRGHHAGAHSRGVRRTHEVLGIRYLRSPLGDARLRPRGTLGLGHRRLAEGAGRAGLRRRHGRAHQRRHRGAGDGPPDRQAQGV